MTTNERPTEAVGNVMLDISPHMRVNVWVMGVPDEDAERLACVYDAVRIWLSKDDKARARLMPAQPAVAGSQQAAQPAQATGTASAPPRQAAPRGGQQKRGSGLFCPDHPSIELLQSAEQYQEYDEVDGERLPAKFFCPGKANGTGKNHSVWRSKAVRPFVAARQDDIEPSDELF